MLSHFSFFLKGSNKDVMLGSCINLFLAELDNLPMGNGFKLKFGKVRCHSRKSYFTCEMKVRSLSVIQMGLSCAVVELEASSTGKGLVQVCIRAELGFRPEERCKADLFEVMSCCQIIEFAI